MDRTALIVIDVQKGFDDPAWGRRDNPDCEDNVAALVAAWHEEGEPIVFVRHDSEQPGSPLQPGQPGNAFKDVLIGEPDLLVRKSVNSAFHGTPNLESWLRGNGVDAVVISGIQTNMCCETTARVAANLGFRMTFALDATHTFDLPDHEGGTIAAETLARVTRANLDPEFGGVVTTAELLGGVPAALR